MKKLKLTIDSIEDFPFNNSSNRFASSSTPCPGSKAVSEITDTTHELMWSTVPVLPHFEEVGEPDIELI